MIKVKTTTHHTCKRLFWKVKNWSLFTLLEFRFTRVYKITSIVVSHFVLMVSDFQKFRTMPKCPHKGYFYLIHHFTTTHVYTVDSACSAVVVIGDHSDICYDFGSKLMQLRCKSCCVTLRVYTNHQLSNNYTKSMLVFFDW